MIHLTHDEFSDHLIKQKNFKVALIEKAITNNGLTGHVCGAAKFAKKLKYFNVSFQGKI